MRYAKERQQMMLANRVEWDVFDNHHFIVRLSWNNVKKLAWIAVQSGTDLLVHQRHATRSSFDSGTFGIFTGYLPESIAPCLDL
jgi:hypothetical protein